MRRIFYFLIVILLTAPLHAGVRAQLRQGGRFYRDAKYGSALNSYQQILRQDPQNQQALFNAGNAYYRLQHYTQAQDAFEQAAQAPGKQSQDALFNLGNAYYRSGNRQKAIESYKAAILQNPQDKEAIHNLQLVLRQEQQEKQNQNNQNNPDNRSNNQDQQDQNNQGQAPQQQPQQNPQGQLNKNDADRVMAMAKENEHRRSAAAGAADNQTVEKDW